MEAEVRDILRNAVAHESGVPEPLGTRISMRFRSVGLDAPVEELRGWGIRAPDLSE
jgi:plasmid stability protein